jgi:hypothetical protein
MSKVEVCFINKYSFIFTFDRHHMLHHNLHVLRFLCASPCSTDSLFLTRFLRQTSYNLVPVRQLRNVPRSGSNTDLPL